MRDLPRGIHHKHGAYYRVAKGKWDRIGTIDDLLPSELPRTVMYEREDILKSAYKTLTAARQNAKGRREMAFELTRDDVLEMLTTSNYRCTVTGTPFSLEVIAGQRPFAPSIDRRDCAIGYLKNNCRIVCVAVNYAMNVWGEEVFRKMMKNFITNAYFSEKY